MDRASTNERTTITTLEPINENQKKYLQSLDEIRGNTSVLISKHLNTISSCGGNARYKSQEDTLDSNHLILNKDQEGLNTPNSSGHQVLSSCS